jgi:hypothetical protein
VITQRECIVVRRDFPMYKRKVEKGKLMKEEGTDMKGK